MFGLTTLALVLAGFGCGPQVVPSTGPHAPTSADAVKIYDKPPHKYELLGTVTVSAGDGVKWGERGDADAGFARLKERAAALGANGLLMNAPQGEFDGRISASEKGVFHQIPVRGKEKTAVAQAIYMLEE